MFVVKVKGPGEICMDNVHYFQITYNPAEYRYTSVPIEEPLLHFKDTMPKIRNKDSQKRNCAATVPIPTFMFL
jgi:hypothetical protein